MRVESKSLSSTANAPAKLNPFLDTTDGCLFSWTREREFLEAPPCTIRIREAPSAGAVAALKREWREIIEGP